MSGCSEGSHEGEGVSHRVQEVHAFARAEVVESGDRWLDRQRAGGDNERVVLEKPLVVTVRTERYAVPVSVDLAGDGVEP